MVYTQIETVTETASLMMQPGCGQMALSQQHSSRDAYRNDPPPYPGVSAGSNFYQPGKDSMGTESE